MQTIDFVVPMLFHEDEVWQKEYERFTGKELLPMDFYPLLRSWGTEELVIKGVLKFMPWIRTIHIILFGESQVQPWMEKYGDKIHIVYHRDFIPEEYLPCFNSSTIETFIGDIKDLAPMFIYGNDDVYPVAPMEPEDFFRDGKPCQSLSEEPYTDSIYDRNTHRRKCFNELNLIAPDFKKVFTDTYLVHHHGLSAILRKTCRDVWKKHDKEICERVFAERTDRSITQYIYCYWQHLSGKYVNHLPATKVVSFWDKTAGILEAVNDKDVKVVCVNDDNVANSVWKQVGENLYAALEKRIEQTENGKEE